MSSNVEKPDVRTGSGFSTRECPHYSTLRRGVHIVASASYFAFVIFSAAGTVKCFVHPFISKRS